MSQTVRAFYNGDVERERRRLGSTPVTAAGEIADAGLQLVTYCGAEGFAGGMRPMVERLAAEQPSSFANLVQMGAETSELLQYRDATEHLHIVVRKTSD